MPMTTKSYLGLGPHGFHRIVYFEWGDPANNQVVVCVHGLTRRGRDFDFLARTLEDRYRVICVDLPDAAIATGCPSPPTINPAPTSRTWQRLSPGSTSSG